MARVKNTKRKSSEPAAGASGSGLPLAKGIDLRKYFKPQPQGPTIEEGEGEDEIYDLRSESEEEVLDSEESHVTIEDSTPSRAGSRHSAAAIRVDSSSPDIVEIAAAESSKYVIATTKFGFPLVTS